MREGNVEHFPGRCSSMLPPPPSPSRRFPWLMRNGSGGVVVVVVVVVVLGVVQLHSGLMGRPMRRLHEIIRCEPSLA